jgi:phosphoglycolate phosphatase-like HAD superfamily hydrolase
VQIELLADRPEFIPTLAEWHFREWAYLRPGDSVANRIRLLHERSGRVELPVTFVASSGSELLGSRLCYFIVKWTPIHTSRLGSRASSLLRPIAAAALDVRSPNMSSVRQERAATPLCTFSRPALRTSFPVSAGVSSSTPAIEEPTSRSCRTPKSPNHAHEYFNTLLRSTARSRYTGSVFAVMHLVMFDVDGTLVDSAGFDGALYAQAVREVLQIPVDETWASYRNATDSGILEQLLAQHDFGPAVGDLRAGVKRRFVELFEDYAARHPSAVREIPGAKALIDTLCTIPSVRVAVATGGWLETASLKLKGIGLAIERLAIATASDSADRTTIMQIAERRAMLGFASSRKTYFGDGAWDQRASAHLGYQFIAIGRNIEHDLLFQDFSDREAVLACLAV